MGAGMAASLLKAGHDVTVYNRTRTKVEALVAQGAKAANSVSDACSGDAVITMLANDDAVESVVFSDGGIIGSLLAGAIHISSSTVSIALSERLEAGHAKAGQRFVAAPVSAAPMSPPRPSSSSSPPVRRMRSNLRNRSSMRSGKGPSSSLRRRRPPISWSSAATS